MNDEKFQNKVYKILIVDDEADELNALSLTLQFAKEFKSEISTAENPTSALAKLENQNFDLVLSDFQMPTMDGIEFLNKVKERHPKTIRMLITGYTDIEIAKQAINEAEIHNFIEKPWYNDKLRSIIYDALKEKYEKIPESSTQVADVNDALKVINSALGNMFNNTEKQEPKRKIILQFTSPDEFNKFYHEIKDLKNVNVDDISISENKYIIELRF